MTPIDVLRGVEQALRSQDLSSLGDFIDDAAAWESDAFTAEPVAQGLGAIRASMQRILDAFPKCEFTLGEPMLNESVGHFEFKFSGVNTGRLVPFGATNRSLELVGAGFASFDPKSGKITRLRTHWNCLWALSQLGIRPYGRPGPQP